jgi:hypothetical protein
MAPRLAASQPALAAPASARSETIGAAIAADTTAGQALANRDRE